MNTGYMKNADGVHFISCINSEFSICGDAYDISDVSPESGDMENVTAQPITCPKCKEQIDAILKEFCKIEKQSTKSKG